ncbi:MAG TPA: DUF4115 domain-containing protein [Nitrosomonas sp.]|nr:DUF4115 domain-containing protein [Nitrosomonas sp.]
MNENNGDNEMIASNGESMMSRSEEMDNLNNRALPESIGQILRDERIKRNLSIGEVSRRLRLSEQKIAAIEENDFSKLPSGTFLRGFIRNYANFLQLDFNSLIPLLSQSAGVIVQQNSNRQSKTIPLESRRLGYSGSAYRLFISAFIVLSIMLLGYGIYNYGDWGEYFVVKNGGDTSNTQADSLKQENGQTTMELSLPLPNLPSTSWNTAESFKPINEKPVTTESPSLPPVTTEIKETAQTNVLESSTDSGEKTVQLTFSRESWVEIRDSKKKVIFMKTNARGSEQVVKGTPPLYLVIGNASGVGLTYNGKLVDLAPYTRKADDVARFSLE